MFPVSSFAKVTSNEREDVFEKHMAEKISNMDTDTLEKLIALDFPIDRIKYLSEEEIQEIVENNYTFIGDSGEQTYLTLYSHLNSIDGEYYLTEESKSEATFSAMIPITEDEKEEYFKDKAAFRKYVVYNLEEISKKRDISVSNSNNNKDISIDDFINAINKSKIGLQASFIEDEIDYGILTLGVNAYDMSTSTVIKKKLGIDFHWVEAPFTNECDQMGLGHSAFYLGMTNYYDMGGSYSYYYGNTWRSRDSVVTPYAKNGGMEVDVDLYLAWFECYGRAWIVIGNNKSAVTPNAEFFITGEYGHITKGTNLSVGVDIGGNISFTPDRTTEFVSSTPVSMNRILTY